jgi:hypothetical protein
MAGTLRSRAFPVKFVTACVGDYSEMAALSKGGGRRMSFPKKHIYQKGSPGAAREKAKTTLTQIKREIERDPAMRREYQKRVCLRVGVLWSLRATLSNDRLRHP